MIAPDSNTAKSSSSRSTIAGDAPVRIDLQVGCWSAPPSDSRCGPRTDIQLPSSVMDAFQPFGWVRCTGRSSSPPRRSPLLSCGESTVDASPEGGLAFRYRFGHGCRLVTAPPWVQPGITDVPAADRILAALRAPDSLVVSALDGEGDNASAAQRFRGHGIHVGASVVTATPISEEVLDYHRSLGLGPARVSARRADPARTSVVRLVLQDAALCERLRADRDRAARPRLQRHSGRGPGRAARSHASMGTAVGNVRRRERQARARRGGISPTASRRYRCAA